MTNTMERSNTDYAEIVVSYDWNKYEGQDSLEGGKGTRELQIS